MARPVMNVKTEFNRNVSLAGFTTLGIGGKAKYFLECRSVEGIRSALDAARRDNLRVHVLGGGSNTIFADEGFDGLVLKIALQGIQIVQEAEHVRIVVAAGEGWDKFVEHCVRHNFAGIECLSGIPGLVGATPIQNVGAYGQEVADTIVSVKALDRQALTEVTFMQDECRFAYRRSRFNSDDLDRFIVLEVTFRLSVAGEPQIRYPELRKYIDSNSNPDTLSSGSKKLEAVRSSVLSLRKRKSMVIDPADPNTRSVGSFFKNPVLAAAQLAQFEKRCREHGVKGTIPGFSNGDSTKIPAAWLVENSGFGKGFRKNGVGISSNHSLALVNYNGTARELLFFAEEIRTAVMQKFGISLEREPVVVQ